MLYGELGRYPINILCKSRMVGFWQRIINGKHDKIAYRLYKILLSMHQRDLFHSRWLLLSKNALYQVVLIVVGSEHFGYSCSCCSKMAATNYTTFHHHENGASGMIAQPGGMVKNGGVPISGSCYCTRLRQTV